MSPQRLDDTSTRQIHAALTRLDRTIVRLAQTVQDLQSTLQSLPPVPEHPDCSQSSPNSVPSNPSLLNSSTPGLLTASRTADVSQGTLFPPIGTTYTSPFHEEHCSCHFNHPLKKTKE